MFLSKRYKHFICMDIHFLKKLTTPILASLSEKSKYIRWLCVIMLTTVIMRLNVLHWEHSYRINAFYQRITQTQDIFSLAGTAWKHPKYPCFCILPLEFDVNIDIHKHENSEVIYSHCNKSPKEMSGNSKLQKHGKHVKRFILTECAG